MATTSDYGAYKYQWARHVARKRLQEDIYLFKEKASQLNIPDVPSMPNMENLPLRDIARGRKVTLGKPPKKDGEFKVGIVGAGCSGLFTGLIIDYLNEKFKGKFNITYDILEAAAPERLGGRLYTYKFSETTHDYYDVGAMRFPKNDIMGRTFKLFDFLGITKESKKLIPYYLVDQDPPNGVCPSHYNDVQKFGKFAQWGSTGKEISDPFRVNEWLPEDDPRRIPKEFIVQDPNKIVDNTIEKFKEALRKDLDKKRTSKTEPADGGAPDDGWNILNRADFMSTREFFRATGIPELEDTGIKGPGLNFNTIEWMETFAYATGWYNQALSETVLESLDFETTTPQDWFCIDGGTQQVAALMAEKLKGAKPQFNRQVTAIIADTEKGSVSLKIKHNEPGASEIEEREYFTVFNSTTFGALQRMDLTKAKLLYGTKQAIRSLAYGASCKVGMKFKTPWWMLPPHNINQGGMGKTDLPLRVCVYPSYNIHDKDTEPAVLLCSYTWAQDAQRIGTLIKPDSPTGEEELKQVLFHNLALLHATDDKPYDVLLPFIKDQYITHHAWDWYCDPNMSGAFAYFGPGQFSNMWPEIIKPNGWLFLIGEAASAHHAWIVGALESAVRGVYQLLEQLELCEHAADFTSYADAMETLRVPKGDDQKLPFGGVPRELPTRQEGTEKGAELQDTPEADLDLSFVAAQCIASFYELMIELAEEGGEVK